MGKFTEGTFEKRKNDFWQTPYRAVRPLLDHLPSHCSFVEPCAGDGSLIDHLTKMGHRCVGAVDIDPRRGDIRKGNANSIRWRSKSGFFITNPPWTRAMLHPIILHLCSQTPSWLLFEADWMHTKQSLPFLPMLRKIVSVGRVDWLDNGVTGKTDVAWYLFDNTRPPSFTEFIGRRD